MLALCSDRDLATLDPPVREVLRLGTHQLLATRVAAHAAVATSVTLVRQAAGPRPAGFVNAVLRRVATHDLSGWLEIAAPDRATDPAGHLAVRHSHPRWIVEALPPRSVGADGLAQTEALLAADNERPRVTLRTPRPGGPGRADRGGLPSRPLVPVRGLSARGRPGGILAVAAGRAGVQDEASQLAAIASRAALAAGGAALQVGERWLDLCAGPGGKARLLAGLAISAGARLTAAELREHRARLVAARDRGRGDQRHYRGRRHPPAWPAGAFEPGARRRALHGLGALRRRPEARWRRGPGDVASLQALQRELLRTALTPPRRAAWSRT